MMLNVRALPFGSAATGVNEYGVPAITVVAAFPVMVGALLAAATT